MNSPDERQQRRARALYAQAAQQIDTDTAARLRQARRAAMEAAQRPAALRLQRLLLPAGAFAMLALASLMLWQPAGLPGGATHGSAAPSIASAAAPHGMDLDSELPPDADDADPKLYQNLDFYGWLAANSPQQSNR